MIILIGALGFIKLSQLRNWMTSRGAPYEPLAADVVERVIKLAEIKPGEVFYDLGSGDGRVVVAAAMVGAQAVGVEFDFFRTWYSRFWIMFFGLRNRARIIQNDIFDQDISGADVVFTYLLPETNKKLYPKLKKELKEGTRIVSAAFSYPKMKPEKVDPDGPPYGPLYLYKIKKRKNKFKKEEIK